MLGYCPNCNKQIFKMTKGKLERPLGNYRSVKLIMEDNSSLTAPICMDCEKNLSIPSVESFVRKLFVYSQPLKETEKEYLDKYNHVVKIIKQGPLSVADKERNQIWR